MQRISYPADAELVGSAIVEAPRFAVEGKEVEHMPFENGLKSQTRQCTGASRHLSRRQTATRLSGLPIQKHPGQGVYVYLPSSL
jgi:hypothetical protein